MVLNTLIYIALIIFVIFVIVVLLKFLLGILFIAPIGLENTGTIDSTSLISLVKDLRLV